MTIISRDQVRQAVAAAMLAGATTEEAIAAAATALALPPEAVAECIEVEGAPQ